MFRSSLSSILVKTVGWTLFLSALMLPLGSRICFSGPVAGPQIIDNDLYVTKTLRVGVTPNIPLASTELNLIVNGMTSSGKLTVGPWPRTPDRYVFFGANTLDQSEQNNYALLQSCSGNDKGLTLLNSPVEIKLRINNKDKMIISNSGKIHVRHGIESMETDGGTHHISIMEKSKGNVVLVQGGGNVGIGSNPDKHTRLSVRGTSYFRGRITCDHYVLAKGFTETSDANLKAHIAPLSNPLEKLAQIRGVSFEWNDKSESKGYSAGEKGIGVVAQEVETVFPELVVTSQEDGYKSVDYSRLTSVLIEAVKELKAKNDFLTRRIEALEKASVK